MKLREFIGILEVKITLYILKRHLVPDFMENKILSILTTSSLFIWAKDILRAVFNWDSDKKHLKIERFVNIFVIFCRQLETYII